MAVEEPIRIDLEMREDFLSKLKYNPSECYQCGTCTATCPLNGIHEEKLTIRNVLHKAQVGMPADPLVWECTSCKLCETRCPREVDIVGSFQALRGYLYRKRELPTEYEQLLWNILEESNPMGEPKGARTSWMRELDIPVVDGKDTLFYVGTAAAYDPRLQNVANSMAKVMMRTGVDFGVLGKQEPASGEAVLEIGDEAFLDYLLEKNVEQFNDTGVKEIVVLSPHAYNIMKNLYPQYGLEAEVLHYTEYLDRMWSRGNLNFAHKFDMQVTYHDPCYLGRYNGVYDAPRNLIEGVPGVELVEMRDTKSNAMCCGGGGDQIYRNSEDGVRLSDLRVEQAADTGSVNMLTSCGYCIQNFEDSTKTTGKDVQINDVVELVLMSMEEKR